MTRWFAISGLLVALSACAGSGFETWDPSYSDKAKAAVNRGVAELNGDTERNLVHRFGSPRERYDYADGGRRLSWRVRQSNDRRFWCELTADVNTQGRVTKASWRYSGNIGGLRHCNGWLGRR